MVRSLLIIVVITALAKILFADDGVSNPLVGPWSRIISCDHSVVIDVNSYNSYQLVLKNELADKFSSVRSRNPKNQSEVIIGNLVYYGPHGCSIPEMYKQTFVQWDHAGNAAIQIKGAHSLLISIQNGARKETQILENCLIPDWMVPREAP